MSARHRASLSPSKRRFLSLLGVVAAVLSVVALGVFVAPRVNPTAIYDPMPIAAQPPALPSAQSLSDMENTADVRDWVRDHSTAVPALTTSVAQEDPRTTATEPTLAETEEAETPAATTAAPSTTAPAPAPVRVPTPAPEPEPSPVPAPEPEPSPVSAPEPDPAPVEVEAADEEEAPASPSEEAGSQTFQDYARAKVGAAEFACLDKLWGRESGWDPTAQNASSSAYGIPQFLDSTWASTGIAKTSNGYRQIDAGLIYIESTYGSPCAAWAHSQATGWY